MLNSSNDLLDNDKTFWCGQCLDYFFLINPVEIKDIGRLDVNTCTIESFAFNDKAFRQISDHNGLSVELEVIF